VARFGAEEQTPPGEGRAVLHRSLLVAPPPLGGGPVAPARRRTPAVPEVARTQPAPASGSAQPPGAVSRIFASAAELFAAASAAPARAGGRHALRDTERGHPMSEDRSVIRRVAEAPTQMPAAGLEGGPAALQSPSGLPLQPGSRELDEFVDLVVERIEQRVVDELERRGKRVQPGVF
jgi:hypothetical protein